MWYDESLGILLNNPLFLALAIFGGGIGTLLFAVEGQWKLLLHNPAVILGDMLALPLGGYLVGMLYQSFQIASPVTDSFTWDAIVFLLSCAVTLAFGMHFRLLTKRWIPHGIFFCIAVYIFLNAITRGGYYFLAVNVPSAMSILFWFGIIVIVLFHQIIGAKWPKKF